MGLLRLWHVHLGQALRRFRQQWPRLLAPIQPLGEQPPQRELTQSNLRPLVEFDGQFQTFSILRLSASQIVPRLSQASDGIQGTDNIAPVINFMLNAERLIKIVRSHSGLLARERHIAQQTQHESFAHPIAEFVANGERMRQIIARQIELHALDRKFPADAQRLSLS